MSVFAATAYSLIAERVRWSLERNPNTLLSSPDPADSFLDDLCHLFTDDNPRFNRARFLAACNPARWRKA